MQGSLAIRQPKCLTSRYVYVSWSRPAGDQVASGGHLPDPRSGCRLEEADRGFPVAAGGVTEPDRLPQGPTRPSPPPGPSPGGSLLQRPTPRPSQPARTQTRPGTVLVPRKSGVSSSFLPEKTNCRVGKGRPAGSIELRVSPSPSKIPYGGFSPVRLQMDRQWRPSTTSRGLSAVHIRLMRPSYTPPQLQLPGIRDPRRDYPFENLSVQCGTTPQQLKHVHPEALGSPSGYVVPTGHRLLRPHARL